MRFFAMCLTFSQRTPKGEVGPSLVAWKVFSFCKAVGAYYSPLYPLHGAWKEGQRLVTDLPGFHAFETKEDAERWIDHPARGSHIVVRKVLLEDVREQGTAQGTRLKAVAALSCTLLPVD